MRYLDEFVRCKCAVDMLALKLFPNAKEITESFAAFDAVRTHLPHLKLSDPGVTVVAVGDGHTPRTASTFAFRSAWRCFSVDPNLRSKDRWAVIRRLTMLPARVENVTIEADGPVVVVAVHSHARLEAAVKAIRSPVQLSVVAIPCCVQQTLGVEPGVSYVDAGIKSACNRVLVWREVLR